MMILSSLFNFITLYQKKTVLYITRINLIFNVCLLQLMLFIIRSIYDSFRNNVI